MRPLALLAVLSLAVPPRAAAEWNEQTDGIKPERAYQLAVDHLLGHEIGQKLIGMSDNIPYSDAHAERIVQAKTAIREVEAGCVAPCTDADQIVLYSGKIDFIGERLKMTPDRIKTAKDKYVPQGKPRLRPANLKYTPDENMTKMVDQRVIEAQLQSTEMPLQVRQALTRRSQQMSDALGKTLGPGDFDAVVGGDVTAGGSGGGGKMSVGQYASLPGAQSPMYGKHETVVPGVGSGTAENPRLEAAIVRTQSQFPDDPKMQQGVRYLMTAADKRLRDGGKPSGALFENFFGVSSYETKLNLLVSDELKSYRGDYGGASGAMPASVSFTRDSGVDLSNGQLADLDHFFYASGSGSAGIVGGVACVGMSGAWDGLLPTAKYVYQAIVGDGDEKALDYNYEQVKTDLRGCRHGAATP